MSANPHGGAIVDAGRCPELSQDQIEALTANAASYAAVSRRSAQSCSMVSGAERECNATSTTAAMARTLRRDNKFMSYLQR